MTLPVDLNTKAVVEKPEPQARAVEVVRAMGSLAERNKLGPDSAEYQEIARLAPVADEKAQLKGEGVYASIQNNVLRKYGDRQELDATIQDAKGENPEPETVKTFTAFARKIKTHIGATGGLQEAFDKARAESAVSKLPPMNLSGAMVDVKDGSFVANANFATPAKGKTAAKERDI